MKSPCFEHVYREFNGEADSLSKEGLQLVDGTGIWREIKDDNLIQEHPFSILHPQMRIPLTARFLKMNRLIPLPVKISDV